MNVVVATDFAYVNGGAGRIALESAAGLARRGHRVILFTAVGRPSAELRALPGVEHVSLEQQDVWRDPNVVRAAAQGLWNWTASRRLGEILADLDPRDTIVHVHSWSKALSSSIVRATTSRGVAIVATLHDFLSVCPTGTLFDHRTSTACRLRPMSIACMAANCDSRSYAQKLWRITRQAVQARPGRLPGGIRHFITVSDASADTLGPLLPAGATLHRVDNFTDVAKGPPADVERHRSIVYVGRLSPEKGPLLLASCLAALKLPGVFVGDGELAAAIQACYPSAELAGWLAPDAVLQRMREARALVLPSLWYETQGLVVAEAAANGVPSIVPDTSAARDWVSDGVTGLWFRCGDEASLRAAITRVMDSPELAASFGRAAYERFWASPPTLDRHLGHLERVYGTVIQTALHLDAEGRPAASVVAEGSC
jgi:glycosyltransferase involved in cell wall biosynthesis